MAVKTAEQLGDEIDLVVSPRGGTPKVTAPQLNALLHDLHDTLAAPAPARVYEEVLHFPAQPLLADTVFEPSSLLRLVAGPGVARVELAVGAGEFAVLLAAPATEYAPSQPLSLPVGILTYRVTFQEGVSYAALKQIIRLDETPSI